MSQEDNKKYCYVLRGIPGSGKSTRAKEIKDSHEVDGKQVVTCSADDYFMQPIDGDPNKGWVYKYDSSKIAHAHYECRRKASHAMRDGVDVVIIDNTNVRSREMYPYVEMAVIYGYEVELVEPQTPWWHSVKPLLKGNKSEKAIKPHCKVFFEKNTHDVPEHTILKMLMRWDSDLTPELILDKGE